jgi:hypothetical protein
MNNISIPNFNVSAIEVPNLQLVALCASPPRENTDSDKTLTNMIHENLQINENLGFSVVAQILKDI